MQYFFFLKAIILERHGFPELVANIYLFVAFLQSMQGKRLCAISEFAYVACSQKVQGRYLQLTRKGRMAFQELEIFVTDISEFAKSSCLMVSFDHKTTFYLVDPAQRLVKISHNSSSSAFVSTDINIHSTIARSSLTSETRYWLTSQGDHRPWIQLDLGTDHFQVHEVNINSKLSRILSQANNLD